MIPHLGLMYSVQALYNVHSFGPNTHLDFVQNTLQKKHFSEARGGFLSRIYYVKPNHDYTYKVVNGIFQGEMPRLL
jgi:hypothetical protein